MFEAIFVFNTENCFLVFELSTTEPDDVFFLLFGQLAGVGEILRWFAFLTFAPGDVADAGKFFAGHVPDSGELFIRENVIAR